MYYALLLDFMTVYWNVATHVLSNITDIHKISTNYYGEDVLICIFIKEEKNMHVRATIVIVV